MGENYTVSYFPQADEIACESRQGWIDKCMKKPKQDFHLNDRPAIQENRENHMMCGYIKSFRTIKIHSGYEAESDLVF